MQAAFAGESQARNKYTYFAGMAKKEGYEQIAQLFLETAENEKEHAKIWYKLLHDGVGTTAENLLAAADEALYQAKNSGRNQVKVAETVGFLKGSETNKET